MAFCTGADVDHFAGVGKMVCWVITAVPAGQFCTSGKSCIVVDADKCMMIVLHLLAAGRFLRIHRNSVLLLFLRGNSDVNCYIHRIT